MGAHLGKAGARGVVPRNEQTRLADAQRLDAGIEERDAAGDVTRPAPGLEFEPVGLHPHAVGFC